MSEGQGIGELTGPGILSGKGSPEGVYSGQIGTMYRRTDGFANATLYVKESGTGNTGWVGYGLYTPPNRTIVQVTMGSIPGQPSTTAVQTSSIPIAMFGTLSGVVGGPYTINPRYSGSTFRITFGLTLQCSATGTWLAAGVFQDITGFSECESWGYCETNGGALTLVAGGDFYYAYGTTAFTLSIMATGNTAGNKTARNGWIFVDELKG